MTINHKLFPSAYHATTEMLVEKIKRGEFTPDPPIIFDEREILVDGHHRMAAIYHSGQTVQVGIRFQTFQEFMEQDEAKTR